MTRGVTFYEILEMNEKMSQVMKHFKLRSDTKVGDKIGILGNEKEHERLGQLTCLKQTQAPLRRNR